MQGAELGAAEGLGGLPVKDLITRLWWWVGGDGRSGVKEGRQPGRVRRSQFQ